MSQRRAPAPQHVEVVARNLGWGQRAWGDGTGLGIVDWGGEGVGLLFVFEVQEPAVLEFLVVRGSSGSGKTPVCRGKWSSKAKGPFIFHSQDDLAGVPCCQ